jgi:hypothetical protein
MNSLGWRMLAALAEWFRCEAAVLFGLPIWIEPLDGAAQPDPRRETL